MTLKELACRTIQWDSNCPRKEGFQYGSADKGSNNRPCHNVPVVCRLCIHRNKDTDWRTAIWCYNLEAHLTKEHPEYANPGKLEGVALPRVVFDSVVLTAAEEKRAGVPIRPAFTLVQEKENEVPGHSRTQKRKADAQTFVSAASLAKRVWLGVY